MLEPAADGLLYYSCLYFGAIAAMATWEALAPRRALARPLRRRWLANFGVTAIDSLLVRALLPFTSMGAAAVAAERGIGLLNQLAAPPVVGWLAAFVVLDASRYAQHVALHRVPSLWRLHRMHHTDADYDSTTALRFHPTESLLTTGIALILVLALGLPVAAVCAYELVFTGVAFFAHANVRLPARTDRWLRRLVVTPDLHRVHHSASEIESDSNFGGVFPWWDRAFGSYRSAPALGHDAMRLGLTDFADPRHEKLTWMLANPFLEARATGAPVSEIAAGG
jgi:sterol desaturase/sphingolipid hydroxylase (fatty acid hydroxylase superfamily)